MILEIKNEGTLVTLSDFYDVCIICVQSRCGVKRPETENEMSELITSIINELIRISLFEDQAENAPAIIKRIKHIYCYSWRPLSNG
jgi:hypothetical protein